MILTITNQCNRRCPYCFESNFLGANPCEMTVDDVDALCRFFRLSERRPPHYVTIMGGEPTLHPELLEIIGTIRSHNPNIKILLLTNLTCDPDLTVDLVEQRIGIMANIAQPEHSTEEQREAIAENQALLAQVGDYPYTVAATICREDESFEYLYRMLRKDQQGQITNLRIGLAAPGRDFTNVFIQDGTDALSRKYLELVTTCHEINPRMSFSNECAVNLCLMSEEVYDQLKEVVECLDLVCHHPNPDILPDFSTHWCFAFDTVPELRINNIFDYPDFESVERELNIRMREFLRRVKPQCPSHECTKLRCKGPCPALSYHRYMTSQP